ncbi:hypothetical protein [Streptomyces sp. MNP-20]|uniref:hypothetical protein n=1 Tax=Streptomyces sp. MNP-20 TaxID=2721165 RepID=UPI0015517205|nr:hypothetical protein [Streptomyces sp. MNP-20]
MFATCLLVSLDADNGVASTVLLPLPGGVLMDAVFTATCFLERRRQQRLSGDH